MARDRGRLPAAQARRGDRVEVRGRSEEVKAVRFRPSCSGAQAILVLKVGRSVRRRADEAVPADRRGSGGRRRGWFW